MGNLEETREWLASVAAEGLGRMEFVRFVDRSRVREWRWSAYAAASRRAAACVELVGSEPAPSRPQRCTISTVPHFCFRYSTTRRLWQ